MLSTATRLIKPTASAPAPAAVPGGLSGLSPAGRAGGSPGARSLAASSSGHDLLEESMGEDSINLDKLLDETGL